MTYCHMGACPDRGRQRFGTRILCDAHHRWATEVRARISHVGYGTWTAPAPDWPTGWAELTCFHCQATWVGPVGEDCGWCLDRLEAQRRGQATLALIEPDIDPDAATADIDRVRQAWTQRLAVAVEAELVTTAEAAEAVNAWLAKMADREEVAA